ncbi:class I SAM-dependent methyltransferase [Tengunoibacter tsumagoiensis]|uniref:Uncharacterized protein n=1 Tax=Tengunoibacter tsumagoiensis TaxID=2014871 RepID=A0A401ZU80_9CHLR|nr:class I SAM-dependent methyltransferase [Tengunoibacter tsumagoiensis]GCE10498.1 hypothetical protein KTT_03570 [Tengunoibacter tsumagoiensis]
MWRNIQNRLRRRRFRFFLALLATVPRPLTILDVGGTPDFWEQMQFADEGVTLTLYNLDPLQLAPSPGAIGQIVGDARNMTAFADQQFDIVFSNSVIEHVGDLQQQAAMAQEIQRVGRRYYIQTPNRYFPIEPHVLLPMFQFWPRQWQIWMLTHFKTPWGWRLESLEEVKEYVAGIRLLTGNELRHLFPGACLYRETFLGLTKSLTAYRGW